MDISSFNRRDSFFVPSIKCQSLLGKAVQEHFTKPDQVASVFASSPSLQNSSAGANFLTNFMVFGGTIDLVRTVFTPEDCFSCQFAPALCFNINTSEESWGYLFSFFQNLRNNKYLEASLRSLEISSKFITDEQLDFMLSNLKRINKLELKVRSNV
jgi:hypothetical protein